MDFERAAQLRDRIRAMSHIHSRQAINPTGFTEADVFALHRDGARILRPGVLLPRRDRTGATGRTSRATPADVPSGEVLGSFVEPVLRYAPAAARSSS